MKSILALMLFLTLTITAQATEQKAYQMSITDINGTKHNVTLSNTSLKIQGFEGKVVFLEFFGYGCPPCLASIPHLIKLQNRHKDKLAIVSVEVWGLSNEQLKVFAKKRGINYTIGTGQNAQKLVAFMQHLEQWQGVPFFIAIDSKGNIQFAQSGIPRTNFDSHFENLFQALSKSSESKATVETNTTADKNTTTTK